MALFAGVLVRLLAKHNIQPAVRGTVCSATLARPGQYRADALEPARWPNDALTIANLGHSTLLVNFFGVRLISDPSLFERVGLTMGSLLTIGPHRLAPAPLGPAQDERSDRSRPGRLYPRERHPPTQPHPVAQSAEFYMFVLRGVSGEIQSGQIGAALLHLGAPRAALDEGDRSYLEAVVKETLRVRPVVPGVGRVVRQERFELAGYQIPPGIEINPSIAVSASGTVAVTYYAVRQAQFKGGFQQIVKHPSAVVTYMMQTSSDGGNTFADPGPVFGAFNVNRAMDDGGQFFLGDYQGLTALPDGRFGAVFPQAQPQSTHGVTDMFFAALGAVPGGGSSGGGAGGARSAPGPLPDRGGGGTDGGR